ncbi:MAG: uncharacterized membrane protein YebE (DUF533 family) [Arenicella sp.]|jgi:uncharacterized membrane protein YebE (DUF533 family)
MMHKYHLQWLRFHQCYRAGCSGWPNRLGSKSSRKIAAKVAKPPNTAVLGGLAYKAYGNWGKNKALGQTRPVMGHDIDLASQAIPTLKDTSNAVVRDQLSLVLIMAMIAVSKADGNIDSLDHKCLFEAIETLELNASEKVAAFDLMSREVSIQEIAGSVSLDEHKAEVYLSAFLAIEVDSQSERTFLNKLAIALELPKGSPVYLEQQADLGVV